MSAVPVAPQALQDPAAESIEPPSVEHERNLTLGFRALSTDSLFQYEMSLKPGRISNEQ